MHVSFTGIYIFIHKRVVYRVMNEAVSFIGREKKKDQMDLKSKCKREVICLD